jgi:DNA polymerase-3 subunit beta
MKIDGEIHADFAIPRAAMLAALESVAHAISTEETRYYLNGVFLHAHGADALRFVACDGHRLAVRTIGAAAIAGDWLNTPGIIIPRKTVAFMIAALKRKGAPDDVRVIVNSVKARFVSGNVDMVTKLIDGSFPDYYRVIPSSNDKRLTIGRAALASAIKSVAHVFTKNSSAMRLRLEPGADLRVDADIVDSGSAESSAPCDYDGAPLDIGFNGRYLAEILDSFGGDDVTIMFADSGSPALIFGSIGESREAFGVLMPMRV